MSPTLQMRNHLLARHRRLRSHGLESHWVNSRSRVYVARRSSNSYHPHRKPARRLRSRGYKAVSSPGVVSLLFQNPTPIGRFDSCDAALVYPKRSCRTPPRTRVECKLWQAKLPSRIETAATINSNRKPWIPIENSNCSRSTAMAC